MYPIIRDKVILSLSLSPSLLCVILIINFMQLINFIAFDRHLVWINHEVSNAGRVFLPLCALRFAGLI